MKEVHWAGTSVLLSLKWFKRLSFGHCQNISSCHRQPKYYRHMISLFIRFVGKNIMGLNIITNNIQYNFNWYFY